MIWQLTPGQMIHSTPLCGKGPKGMIEVKIPRFDFSRKSGEPFRRVPPTCLLLYSHWLNLSAEISCSSRFPEVVVPGKLHGGLNFCR